MPAVAQNAAGLPWQTAFVPVMLQAGCELIVTLVLALLTQSLALVTVMPSDTEPLAAALKVMLVVP